MRRRLGAGAIALGVIVLVLGSSMQPASGQAPDQVGWWYELNSKALPIGAPAPPTVPEGGIYVQQGPDGPMAFGALRFRVTDAASATLTLTTAQGSTTTLGAPLQACATTSAWDAPLPAPGYWEDAPEHGTACTPGVVSTDGKYVAFLFGTLFVTTGLIDVAVVPEDGAPPFAIAFERPADDSLVVKSAPPSFATPSEPPTTFSPPATTPAPTVASPPFTLAAPTAPTSAAPQVAAPPTVAQTVLRAAGFGDPDRGARMAALSGASLIIVGWWLLSSRRVRMPQLIGALGAGGGMVVDVPMAAMARTGGVGRFSRVRERNARALR